MKKIISIIIPILACLLNAPVQAGTCDVWGNQDFTVTFNVVGPASNSYVYLDHSGSHPREVLWYNGYEYGNANYYFDEPNLLAGQPYNIRLEHQVNHNSGTLKYYRKFAGDSEWQLIDVKNDVDLKNGKLTLYEQGSPSQVDCSGSTPDPVEPEVPDDVCQYFPQPIQGMKGYIENTLNVPNKSARALGWSEEYKSYYTVTNKEDLFYYSPNAQQPNKPQYILAGFDKANVDDARDRLYRSPICGSDTGCDVGNNDAHLEARKASEPKGVPTDFGDRSLSLEAHNIGYKCDNTNLCSATRYDVNGKSGIEIKIEKNLDSLWISQNNSPFDQIKVILPDGTNIRNFKAEAGPSDDLRIVIPQESTITFERWEHVGHTKYSFYNNSRINVSGNSVVFSNPIDVTTNYYATIYAPNALVNFQTESEQFYGFILADTVNFNNPITVHGSVTARHLTMKKNVVIQKPDYSCPISPPEPQCQKLSLEDFKSPEIKNWSVTGLNGSKLPFVTSDGRFRLTQNSNNQSTAAAYNYTFPMSDNYILIEFDHYAYGSSDGGDGIALVFSDANVPPSAGAFGGPLGYGVKLKSEYSDDHSVIRDIEGFAGGWLGIGIDEYGNYELQGAPKREHGSRIKNNIAVRGPGIKNSSGKWLDGYQFVKSISSGKRINIDDRPTTVHRYRIEITTRLGASGEEKVLLNVHRKVGSGDWDSLLSAIDVTSYVNVVSKPENLRLSVTASTGGAKNNHEIDNFQVCAEDVNKIVDGIDHFRFEYVSSGDICSSQQVVLKACLDEFCNLTYPSNAVGKVEALEPLMVRLEEIPGAKWLDVNGHELNGKFELRNEKKLQIQSVGADVANLGIAYSSIPQYNFKAVQCKLSDSGQFDDKCEIRFDHALNLFVPDKIAALSFFDGQGHLRGDYNTGASLALCETSSEQDIEVKKDIEFKLSNNSSISEPLSVSVGESEVSLDKSTWKKVQDVHFERGKIDFDVNYNDAGKITLLARVADDSAENSATFVSFPAYFDINTSRLTDGASGVCTEVDKGCFGGFVAASDEFGVKVIARNASGGVTKSYAEPNMDFSIGVKYPDSPKARSGALLHPTLPAESAWVNGILSLNQSVSDVGAFTISVKAPEGANGKSKYLDSEAFKIQDGKTTIGRIYPGLFSVVGNPSLSSLAPGNSWSYGDQSFVYMGQGFGVKEFFVEAFASNGAPLQNYAYFDAHQAQFALFENDSVRSSRFVALPSYSSEWDKTLGLGRSVGRFTGSKDDGLVYNKQSVSESYTDGPFNLNEASSDTNISVMGVVDNDDPTTIGQGKLGVQPDIRFGRIDLDDVGGNQGSTLHVPLRVEYWNGSRFIANPDDSQTDVAGLKSPKPEYEDKMIWSDKKNQSGEYEAVDVALSAGGKVIAGRSRSIEATEAESNRQQSRVWLDLDPSGNDLPWLKYNWDKTISGEENPSSVVTFGIHRGNDRVIYRGEPGLTGQ
ncbi:MSHA biogenesis protein MshQ [Vibrio parahaemolyticus]|nr:MSHA biogenesis protein MshQ [Vibrio parahaemolyticus]